jgi:biopolymer transport protein ExbD
MRLAAQPIRRVQQRRMKTQGRPQLNLVALMDVFTLLVFFFLVHSADLPEPALIQGINLPESLADHAPRETVVVTITKDLVLLRDEPITSAESALSSPRDEILSLKKALQKAREAKGAVAHNSGASGRELTIMGDKSIPFRLLKKVMITCTQAGYGRISLAVLQKPRRSR